MCCRLKKSFAYEELREQLERQCEKYHHLDISGKIGKDSYKEEHGKWVPEEHICEYLRGGVVSTMAVFEAFMSGIIIEAFNFIISECQCKGSGEECSSTLKDENLELRPLRDVKNISLLRHAFQKVVERGKKEEIDSISEEEGKSLPESKKSQKKKKENEEEPSSAGKSTAKAADLFFGDPPSTLKDFIFEHRDWCIKQMRKPLLHDFDKAFKNMFNEKEFSIAEKIFSVTKDCKPIEYHYPLDKDSHAVIEISEKDTICAILRLWCSIRCISAHGMANQTFAKDGALYKKFPDCEKCQNNAQSWGLQMLSNGWSLCEEIEEVYKSKVPDRLDSSMSDHRYTVISSIPNVKEIESSGNKKAGELLEKLGLKQDKCSPGNVYYHISRIAFFAYNLKKRMYITYRLLVRINQFVLLLAFRIKLAVAKYLVKYSEKKNGEIDDLKEGLWGYVVNDNERVQNKIEEVQREHKEKIEEIQKLTCAFS